ncbi:MAG: P-II family nitrogen regulator [Clostridia bacterium]|nr:P-II family nitrogen regulator [Clostridia bacterium]
MKLLVLLIRPSKLDDVRAAAEDLGLHGMTVTQVMGHGRQKGHTEVYRGAAYSVNLVPKLKVEMAVPDGIAATAVERLAAAARTGQVGDGKVFVLPLEGAVRIRTGERGDEAL